ncbi:MAG TPA: EAL domain-containing protein [Bacillota bacterium]
MPGRPRKAPVARQLRAGEYREVLDHVPEALMVCRGDQVVYANHAAAALLGWPDPGQLIGKAVANLVAASAAETMSRLIAGALANAPGCAEDQIVTRDGRALDLEVCCRPADLGDGPVHCLVIRDISERRAFEDQLTQQAFLDPLTGLANRTLFMVRLEHAMLRADRHGRNLAVLFLDLDDFKHVNDSLGHDYGDLLLIEVARRLRASLRQEDTLARLGGDEFTALLEDVADPADTAKVAERIRRRLQQPIQIGDRRLTVSCSIGITVRPPGGSTPGELLRQADIAMYRAKQGGKARHALFEPNMGAQARRRLALEEELRRAVEEDEFLLHYQPVVTPAQRRILGVEALLRWRHPRRGLVYPGEFLAAAEEAGLTLPIGRWVLREACVQVRRWHAAFPAAPPLHLSVNLSPRQLRLPELIDEVDAALAASGLPAACLSLELSERAVSPDDAFLAEVLRALKQRGLTLVLDDFGSGQASLICLKDLPFDVVKIDGRLTRTAVEPPERRSVLRHLISMARALDLQVICEGVENPEQVEALRDFGCDGLQGFAASHPLPPDQFEPLLAAGLPPSIHGEPA